MKTLRPVPTLLAAAVIALPLTPMGAGGAASAGLAAAGGAAPDARILGVRAGGSAFGSRLTDSPLASSGPSLLSRMCTRSYPRVNRNQAAASEEGLGAVADLEEVESKNRTHRLNNRPAVTSTSTVESGELLGGLVAFEGLQSLSRVVKTPGGFRRVSRARLAALEIGGDEVVVEPGNETQTFTLPAGAGTLVYNGKSGRTAPDAAVSRNLALRLELADGSTLRLARSVGRLETGRVGIFRGGAWGTEVPTVAGVLKGGRTSVQPLPCGGTDGELLSNGATDVEPNVVVDRAESESQARTRYLSRGRARAVARTAVNDVSLGGGQVLIDEVQSEAVALKRSNGSVGTSRTTQVAGLTVGGEEVDPPEEGETLEVEGVATIESDVTSRGRRGLEVTALRVTLLDALAEPTVVDVGVAGAYVVH